MKIAVPLDRTPDEPRAAIGPDAVKAYVKKGHDVAVEAGLGKGAYITDAVFKEAGATIAKDAAAAVADADVVLSVRRPSEAVVKALKPGAVVVGLLDPHGDMAGLQALAKAKASAFAMELMPRISRAQSMDVLSSQANLAGYKAVVDAAHHFTRAFPMMMTAAGTVAPAKVFVMGAGVAGCRRSPRRAGWAPSCRPPTCAPRWASRSRASAPSSCSSRAWAMPRPPAAMPRNCRRTTGRSRRS
jgi:H+-translocating NAD(P) transhydrogenase subunit alpha